MSIRAEFKLLKPGSRMNDASSIFVCVCAMLGFYFLDGSRIGAFGLVPAAGILTYSSMRGVRWYATPWLFTLTFLGAATFFVSATLWVIFNF